MTKEELKTRFAELFPGATLEDSGEWVNLIIEPADLLNVAGKLRNTEGLDFDYMFCATCVDWKTHFTMVYHFSSTTHRHNIVLKANLNREKPEIETLCHIWRTAELLEREVYEMFGVNFLNHPDLRLLILPDDWEGYPLRKDYEDPINMIKL